MLRIQYAIAHSSDMLFKFTTSPSFNTLLKNDSNENLSRMKLLQTNVTFYDNHYIK